MGPARAPAREGRFVEVHIISMRGAVRHHVAVGYAPRVVNKAAGTRTARLLGVVIRGAIVAAGALPLVVALAGARWPDACHHLGVVSAIVDNVALSLAGRVVCVAIGTRRACRLEVI